MRYELLRELGATAAGTLYAARDLVTKEVLSIKVAPLDPDGGSALRRRLDHKLRALKGLLHPNTASLHRAGRIGNQYAYVVTEAVHGERLVDMIARRGRLTGAEAAGILRQIVGSLGQAHRQGVTHGGLTSSDVLLEASQAGPPAVKVVGFGTGWLEHVGSDDAGPAAADDLYAVGLILAEMLTGRARVPSDSHPVWGHDKGLLADILRRSTTTEPDRRYTQAEQLSSALDATLPKLRALHDPATHTVASVDQTMTGFPRFGLPTGDQPTVDQTAATKPKVEPAKPVGPEKVESKLAESLPTEEQAKRAATTAALAPLTLPPLKLVEPASVDKSVFNDEPTRRLPSPVVAKPAATPVKREPNLGPPPKKKDRVSDAPRTPARPAESPRRFDPDRILNSVAGQKPPRTPRWQPVERVETSKPPPPKVKATPPPRPKRADAPARTSSAPIEPKPVALAKPVAAPKAVAAPKPVRALPPEKPDDVDHVDAAAAIPVIKPVEAPPEVGAGFERVPTRPTMRSQTGEAPLVFVPLKPGGTEVDLTGPVFVAQLWGDAGLTGDHLVVTASRPAVVQRGPGQLAWAMLRYTAVAVPLLLVGLAAGYLLNDGSQHAVLSASQGGAVSNPSVAGASQAGLAATQSAPTDGVALATSSDPTSVAPTWDAPLRVEAPASIGGIPAADSSSLSQVAMLLASGADTDTDPIELTADLGEPERRLIGRTLRHQAAVAFARADVLSQQLGDGEDEGRTERAREGLRRAAAQLSDCGELGVGDCSAAVEALVWRPELFEQLVATAAALHEASDVLEADDPMRASLVGRSQAAYQMGDRLLRNGRATAQLATYESDEVARATDWLHFDLSRIHSEVGRCDEALSEAQRIAGAPVSYLEVRARAVACAAAVDADRAPSADDVDALLALGTTLAHRADRVEGRVYRARVQLDSDPPNVRVYLEDTPEGRQFLGRTPIDEELESERPTLRLLFSKRRHRARVVEVDMTAGAVDDVVHMRSRRSSSRRSTQIEEPQLRVERID